MSDNKFTPGPWVWIDPKETDETTCECMILRGSDSTEVCNFGDFETYYPTEGSEPNKADRSLIAAAPDPLEAIDDMLFSIGWNQYGKPSDESKKKARAALAKARGES